MFIELTFESTSFFPAISYVVKLCSKPKVIWVNTISNVARMKNFESFWDFSIFYSPRNTMAKLSFSSFCSSTPNAKNTIANFLFRCCPEPTSRSFINVFKEAFGKIFLHGKLILSCVIPRTINVVAGFLYKLIIPIFCWRKTR